MKIDDATTTLVRQGLGALAATPIFGTSEVGGAYVRNPSITGTGPAACLAGAASSEKTISPANWYPFRAIVTIHWVSSALSPSALRRCEMYCVIFPASTKVSCHTACSNSSLLTRRLGF